MSPIPAAVALVVLPRKVELAAGVDHVGPCGGEVDRELCLPWGPVHLGKLNPGSSGKPMAEAWPWSLTSRRAASRYLALAARAVSFSGLGRAPIP